jgi:predicted TIM-barrel fold metal-dependent hydrolase
MRRKINRRQFFSTCAVTAGALTSLSAVATRGHMPDLAGINQKSILERVRAGESLNGIDLVDVHGHFQEAPAGELVWERALEVLLEDMNRCGVGTLVFSHFSALNALTAEELKDAHDRSARAVREHPKRLRAYLVFNPHLADASVREMNRAVEERDSPFVGFKLHGAVHQYPPDGPNYQPVFKFAHEHNLPVLFHVVGTSPATVKSVAGLADKYPNMRLILAHLYPGEAQISALVKDRPNLFVDTALSVAGYRQIERVAASAGAEKLLFGSDAAFLNTGAQISKIGFARIPEEEKIRIFGANARKIFGKLLPPPFVTNDKVQ